MVFHKQRFSLLLALSQDHAFVGILYQKVPQQSLAGLLGIKDHVKNSINKSVPDSSIKCPCVELNQQGRLCVGTQPKIRWQDYSLKGPSKKRPGLVTRLMNHAMYSTKDYSLFHQKTHSSCCHSTAILGRITRGMVPQTN